MVVNVVKSVFSTILSCYFFRPAAARAGSQSSPLMTPEEVAEESLFIRGGVVVDHEREAGCLVLVLWQAVLAHIPLVGGVVGVDPSLHLTQSAVHLLVFLNSKNCQCPSPTLTFQTHISALEEHHLSAKLLLHGVLVHMGLRDGLGDVVAVLVTVHQPLPPLWVGGQGRGVQVESLNLSGVFEVLLDIDLDTGTLQGGSKCLSNLSPSDPE